MKTAEAISIDRLLRVRSLTEEICSYLRPEDQVVQPMVDVSPPKWHLAHTTWFFETFILKRFAENYKPLDEAYNYLFNSYYESIGERVERPNRGNMTRPTTEQVLAYREYVNGALAKLHGKFEGNEPEYDRLLEIGLNHEQQHQELLLTDIKYILGSNPLKPRYKETCANIPEYMARSLVNIPPYQEPEKIEPLFFLSYDEEAPEIGHGGDDFCWDNEKPVHHVYLQP
jgi:hypothetical protein